MKPCCSPRGYAQMFDQGEARNSARDYRRKGLDPTARSMVDYLKRHGVEGRTVLEVGGGVGAVQLELLRSGLERAVNVELSPHYEEAARALLREHDLEERVDRRVMDFAREGHELEPADIVLAHRVVCCYPDMETLVRAAAAKARRFLALSFPRRAWWNAVGFRAVNLWLRLTRTEFQAYLHPPEAILATARAAGLRPVKAARGWIWEVAILERP